VVLGRGQQAPSPSTRDSGERCELPQRGQGPGKFGFWSILGPQKLRQNGQLAFESGGNKCSNVEPPLGSPFIRHSVPVIAASPGIETTREMQTKLYVEVWVGWFNRQQTEVVNSPDIGMKTSMCLLS